MKPILYLSLLLVSINNCLANQTDHQTIESVVKAFGDSIQNKNRKRFLSLFTAPTQPMIAVVSEQGLQKRRALVEKYNKEHGENLVATRTFTITPAEIMDRSAASNVSEREEIDNLKIETDSNIANVYFDYVYYEDDKKHNWGSESWQLVHTINGWKISSVVYSVASQ